MQYKSIITDLSNFYDIYKNPKYIVDDWVIVNNEHYIKNKGKIKIVNANYYTANSKLYNENKEIIDHKQIIIIAETLKKYIEIRYNTNFIAIIESDNEYGLKINDMKLIAIKKMNSSELNTIIPSFKRILKVLDYKITKKANNNLLEEIKFFN